MAMPQAAPPVQDTGGLQPSLTPRPDPPPEPVTRVCVAGAHGGSGASTVASLLRARDPEADVTEVPACPDGVPGQIARGSGLAGYAEGRSLILAVRGTGEGTRRAVTAVTVLQILGLVPPVLAVVADGAGPLPAKAAQRIAQLRAEQRVAGVVHIPFSTALRAGNDPAAARLPGRIRRAVARLAEAAAVRDGDRS